MKDNQWNPEYALEGLQGRIDKIVAQYRREVEFNHRDDTKHYKAKRFVKHSAEAEQKLKSLLEEK